MRTYIYVDGFNLYNRALKGTSYKWLDLRALSRGLLYARNEVQAIRYYTAPVSGNRDPDQPKRQRIYLNALRTLPEVSTHFGNFLPKTITRPLVSPIAGWPRFVEVHTIEEKGSDVNLATHLVRDAFLDLFDVAVVLSKDTDLIEPMRVVRQETQKPVGLFCPDSKVPEGLRQVASFLRHITPGRLAASQFASTLLSQDGVSISKPSEW